MDRRDVFTVIVCSQTAVSGGDIDSVGARAAAHGSDIAIAEVGGERHLDSCCLTTLVAVTLFGIACLNSGALKGTRPLSVAGEGVDGLLLAMKRVFDGINSLF
jgi:hypothetical protein